MKGTKRNTLLGGGGNQTTKPKKPLPSTLQVFGDSIIQTLLRWQEIKVLEESRTYWVQEFLLSGKHCQHDAFILSLSQISSEI